MFVLSSPGENGWAPRTATGISTRLRATIASGDLLDVRSFEVQEGMSTLSAVNLTVVSESADIDFESVAGQDASFVIHGRGGKSRAFTGVAARMSQLEVEASGLSTYHLEIVPKLWLTTRTPASMSCRHRREGATA